MMNYEVLGNLKELRRHNGADFRGWRTPSPWALRNHTDGPHKDTWAIPLRAASTIQESFVVGAHREATPYAARLSPFVAIVNKALAGLNVESVGNVLLVGLRPGGVVTEHTDDGAYAEHFTRIHIVVASEPGNWFKVNGETYFPEVGDIFLFNHQTPHSVGNPTERTRVHLIVDLTLKD